MKLFGSFIIAIIFSSCSSTTNIQISMLEPGAVVLDPQIKTIVLADRSTSLNKKVNKIQTVIKGESTQQEKQGRQQLLMGLQARLSQSPRFKSVLSTNILPGLEQGSIFPNPLRWDSVEAICNANGADALITLETYDSQCIITHESGNVKVNNQFGIPIPSISIFVTQKITVKAGFRIYDFRNKRITDQYNYSFWKTWNSQANSLGEAMVSLLDRQQAINNTSYKAGAYYENHISPVWITENRTLYTKGGGSLMAIGSRQAIVANWKDAEDNWKRALEAGAKRKLAGRITYNLALSCEINGDLEGARTWISKSYGNYNNKKARYYQNTINRRYSDMKKLDKQMATN